MRPLPALLILAATPALADDTRYQRPSPLVARLVEAPPIPSTSLGPDRATLLLATARAFPSIAELAEPELRLAGLRINPANGAMARRGFVQSLALLDTRRAGATPRTISGLPADARIADVAWAPDGAHLAFTITDATTIKLWVADVATASAKPLGTAELAGSLGAPCTWLPNARGLVCRTIPAGGRPKSTPSTVPTGPVIQENLGTKKPARTNPDLLQSPADESLFESFVTSQLAIVTLEGTVTPIGKPALYTESTPSPDGTLLLVSQLHRPFSYRVDLGNFPVRTEVWDGRDGKAKPIATLADLPLAEDVPVDFDAVRTGRRDIEWRADAPATACWATTQDGGDPKKAVAVRDVLECAAAPFTRPSRIASLALRFGGVQWGTGALALVREGWWKERKTRTWIVSPDDLQTKPRVLWDRSSEDRYGDPGSARMRRTKAGTYVLHVTSKGQLLLGGAGASPEGDRPFFDRLDLATGKAERLWRSDGARYGSVVEILDDDGTAVVLSRESPTAPPQLFATNLVTKAERQLTRFAHPVPELAKVKKQLIKWKRKDGLELSAMLYLPPGFTPKRSRPLPMLVWAYPAEFKTASGASQVRGSPYRFVYPSWSGPMFALLEGYAVVDNPTFAIVGEGKAEPNDTYVEQLTADAASLIDAVVAMGVGDRARFAIAGHSYGAFTTANLLAHTDLFATGIARSGAYNRTLTPFGFQSEERTYWEAAETYDRMSPFRYAGTLDEPILLIHGAADNNPGTYPIQSDRLFAALQGLGGRARYVSLPAESHGYRARESALHVLWEQVRWLDLHLKHGKPRAK